jgi:hypothetical protein
MADLGVSQEMRMRRVGHAGREVNDRYTHPLEAAHRVISEQVAAHLDQAGSGS